MEKTGFPLRIAILASGAGSNAAALMQHLAQSSAARISLILTDNPQAGVLEKAAAAGIPAEIMPREVYRDGEALTALLRDRGADLVVLAGYLKLIPAAVVRAYPDRIVNLHPSLLPAYGGKGMYGIHVHTAVLAAGESRSGITVHLVNEVYDQGRILFQAALDILPGSTPATLQADIHALEHRHFPAVVESWARSLLHPEILTH